MLPKRHTDNDPNRGGQIKIYSPGKHLAEHFVNRKDSSGERQQPESLADIYFLSLEKRVYRFHVLSERLRSDTVGRSPAVVCADWIGLLLDVEIEKRILHVRDVLFSEQCLPAFKLPEEKHT